MIEATVHIHAGGAWRRLAAAAMLAVLALAVPALSRAANGGDAFGPDREALSKRLQGVASYSADFTQTVFGVQGEVMEESRGHVWLDRPRFKWVVKEPYPQVLVTTGDKLELYDPDLEQLTVRPLAEALEDTPVSLLTRDAVQLGEHFDVMHVADDHGESFVIDPTASDTLYREIVMHFDEHGLTGLDILDHLGQRTEIRFQPEATPTSIDADTFKLEVPPGTDVVGG